MYAKVFRSMFDGTLRGKSDALLVFVNLLASADREGFVDRYFKGIADETGLALSRVKRAIAELESADPESRSPEFEGKRIIRISDEREWGWKIVNYLYYRDLRNEEVRREQNRVAQQKHRDKPVSNNNQKSAQVEVEAEANADAEAIYLAYPRRVKKPQALKAISKALKKFPASFLLEKTKAYAMARPDKRDRFTPYPATWFNAEQFNDDPASWTNGELPAFKRGGQFAEDFSHIKPTTV